MTMMELGIAYTTIKLRGQCRCNEQRKEAVHQNMTIVLISMEVGCQKMMTKKEEDDDDKDNKAENDNSSSSTLQTPCVASRGGSNNIN